MENAVDAGATRIDVAVGPGRIGTGPRGRQRRGHPGRRAAPGRGQPRHQQIDRGRRSVSRRHAGLPRRGPGLDRRGQPAGAAEPHGRKSRRRRRSKSPAAAPARRSPAAARWARRSRSTTCSSTRRCGGSSSAARRPSSATSARPSPASPWPRPRVHFTLRHNERAVFDLPPPTSALGADRPLLRPRAGREPDLGREHATARCGSPATSPIPAKAAATTACSISSSTAGTSATAPCSTPWARPIAGC